jgi:hypothetical protein
MSINWETDVIGNDLQELADADIAAALAADHRTAVQIPAPAFRRKLREWGVLLKGVTGWTGSIMALYNNPQLKAGIDVLVATFDEGADTLASEREPYASQFAGLTTVIVGAGIITTEQAEELYALGGGKRYSNITEAAVTEARTVYESQQLIALGRAKYNQLEQDFQAKFNAARAAANNVITQGAEAVEATWNEVFA